MTVNTIGRKAFLKYSALSAGGIVFLMTVSALFFGQWAGEQEVTVGRILETYSNEISDNTTFILIQVFVLSATIWVVGGQTGQWIIKKGRNRFLSGGLSILALWVVLFLGSAITAAIANSVKYGAQGFRSAFTGWIIYGLIPFLVFGIINALLLGFA